MLFAATWMQLDIIILSEVSQKEKDKQGQRIDWWCQGGGEGNGLGVWG